MPTTAPSSGGTAPGTTPWPAGVPWSIFSQGGGPAAAQTWAEQLLQAIGAPITAGNVQFVYDWEVSEGGGGAYNPLNQGPVPGVPQLTSTGSQYGGGAANYVSPAAGIAGANDYLNMPNYVGVLSALDANNPAAAKAALIASPWTPGHYGGGSGFSSAALPAPLDTNPPPAADLGAGQAITGTANLGSGSSSLGTLQAATSPGGLLQSLGNALSPSGWLRVLVTVALTGAGLALILLGLSRLFPGVTRTITTAAAGAAGAVA